MKLYCRKHNGKALLSLLLAIMVVLVTVGTAFAAEGPEANPGAGEAVSQDMEAAGESAEGASEDMETAGESAEGASEGMEDSGGQAAAKETNTIPVEDLTITYEDPETLAELTALAEEHALPLEGISNARQLGGYVTEDGRVVRDNLLLRTGELTNAPEETLDMLSDLYHVTTIVDLRNAAEVEETPEPEVKGAKSLHIALREEMAGLNLKALMGEEEDSDLAFIERIRSGWNPLNENMYVDVIKTDTAASGLREILDLMLSQEDGCAILWHCSGGKDRTSVVAVVILTLLGVDKETILKDFELTNILTADEIEEKVEKSKQYTDDETELFLVRATASAIREYMMLAFDYAEEQCGSMLEFIKQRCNVTDEEIEQLKDKYLTDAAVTEKDTADTVSEDEQFSIIVYEPADPAYSYLRCDFYLGDTQFGYSLGCPDEGDDFTHFDFTPDTFEGIEGEFDLSAFHAELSLGYNEYSGVDALMQAMMGNYGESEYLASLEFAPDYGMCYEYRITKEEDSYTLEEME